MTSSRPERHRHRELFQAGGPGGQEFLVPTGGLPLFASMPRRRPWKGWAHGELGRKRRVLGLLLAVPNATRIATLVTSANTLDLRKASRGAAGQEPE